MTNINTLIEPAQSNERADAAPTIETPTRENSPEAAEMRQGDRLDELAQRLDAINKTLSKLADQRDPRELIDAKTAASMLSIARSSFLAKQESNIIPIEPLRIGGRVLYARREIVAWIASGCPAGSFWRERWKALREK